MRKILFILRSFISLFNLSGGVSAPQKIICQTLGLILFSLLFLFTTKSADARIFFPDHAQSGSASVSARVGEFFLNITGYQSPNASIIIKTLSEIFLASTTADNDGYFSFTNIPITKDFPGFCFSAVDFKRIGVSESCFEISDAVRENRTYTDIFLPPTIGLSKKLIAAGEDAIIFGYTMPFAKVDIKFDDETITIQADENGYYEYVFANVSPGVYAFSASATLGDASSLEPTNKAVLESLSLEEQIREGITGIVGKAEKKFPGFLIIAPLLLILLALLIALIWKTKPQYIRFILDKFKKRYPMHHDYFLFKQ